MEIEKFIYLCVLAVLFIVFLIFSFNRKLKIKEQIKYMFPALILSGALFIMFEIRFIEFNIWQFNSQFLIGRFYLTLPIEEWLYYIILPLVGFLIYRLVGNIQKLNSNANYFVAMSLILVGIFAVISYINRQLIYTFVIFMFLTVYFGYVIFRGRFKKHYLTFYISFLFSLIPFFILNSILNGLPVVTYNTEYIIGFFLFKVPIENIAAFFLLYLMNISIYNYLLDKKFY
ncbi:MAG: hypothetical protein HQ541_21720 [Mariniphaga sp.]|nr:hypothetical protein [Mariniphaga sp.]